MKYSILVNSCDLYSDLWNYFFVLLKSNLSLKNCSNIYLNTESINKWPLPVKVNFVNTELHGDDQWGKRFLNSLSKIQEDYVIVVMDDFFLKSRLYECKLDMYINFLDNSDEYASVYLINVLKNRKPGMAFNDLVEIPKYTNYRLNSAPALWKKEKLIKYIDAGDNPWAWEYFGSSRTNKTSDRFFCIKDNSKPLYDYAHAIYRGKWLIKEVEDLNLLYGLNIDYSKRGYIINENQITKRSLVWKIKFLLKGISMVGLSAFDELLRDYINVRFER